jgi:hypothetical protein
MSLPINFMKSFTSFVIGLLLALSLLGQTPLRGVFHVGYRQLG